MLSRERISLNLLAMESTYKIIRAILDKGYKLTKASNTASMVVGLTDFAIGCLSDGLDRREK